MRASQASPSWQIRQKTDEELPLQEGAPAGRLPVPLQEKDPGGLQEREPGGLHESREGAVTLWGRGGVWRGEDIFHTSGVTSLQRNHSYYRSSVDMNLVLIIVFLPSTVLK